VLNHASPVTTRRRNLIALVAVLLAAAVAAYLGTPPHRQRLASDAIPAGAFLVVTMDLSGLRTSPLAKELGTFREVSEVAQRCGFDPIERAKTVAIGVPEKPDGVFGIAVTSDLTRDELAHCADRVMSARGASPHITEKNGWALLEQDAVVEAMAPKGRIAYRDGAPLLVARGDYLASMQSALDGKTPRALGEADAEHAALRKSAEAHSNAPLLLATAVLPKSLRDKLKKELEAEAAAEPGGVATETMNAVLSVSSVAVAISSRASNDLDLFAELRCESESACVTVRDFIDKKRKALAKQAGVRFIGLGALLDALVLEVHGSLLDLTLTAPESEVARVVRGVLSNATPPPATSTLPSPSASSASLRPDETVRAETPRAKDAGR